MTDHKPQFSFAELIKAAELAGIDPDVTPFIGPGAMRVGGYAAAA
jgi:hypothetical protein